MHARPSRHRATRAKTRMRAVATRARDAARAVTRAEASTRDATGARARRMGFDARASTRDDATSDARDVERVVRRVNRRISSAVGAFGSDATGPRDVEGEAGRRGATREATREAGAARLLVWFHGYGDVDGGSWREFCEVVARARGSASGRTAIATPDAMRMDAGNGRFPRAWFKPRLRVRRKDEREWTCDGIEDAVVRAVTIVDDAVRKYGIQRKDVVLGGFSQGACLALACAKSELSDVGGVLAVRGYLPNRSREFSELKPDTLILAGGADPLVPVEWSLEAGRLTGGMVTLRENMGHELCVEDVYRARRWFHERAVANGNCIANHTRLEA